MEVFYARELREYALATLLATVLWLTLDHVLENTSNVRWAVMYTLAACGCLVAQFGLISIDAAGQALFFIEVIRRRQRGGWLSFVISSACMALVSVGVYWLIIRGMLEVKPVTVSYLESNYLSDLSPAGLVAHVWTNLVGLVRFADVPPGWLSYLPYYEFLGGWHWIVFGLALPLGAIVLWTGAGAARRIVLYAAFSLAVVVVMSIVRLYPFGGVRQDIFLTPTLYILAAAGLFRFVDQVVRRPIWKGLLYASFLAPLVLGLPFNFSIAQKAGNFRSAIEYLTAEIAPDDAIYAYWAAAPQFRYYWQDRKMDREMAEGHLIWGARFSPDSDAYEADSQRCFTVARRCWLVFANVEGADLGDERRIVSSSSQTALLEGRFVPFGSSEHGDLADPSIYLFVRNK